VCTLEAAVRQNADAISPRVRPMRICNRPSRHVAPKAPDFKLGTRTCATRTPSLGLTIDVSQPFGIRQSDTARGKDLD
jgi:hypothetical protein